MAGNNEGQQQRATDKAALEASGNRAAATPVSRGTTAQEDTRTGRKRSSSKAKNSSDGKKKKKKKQVSTPTATKATTPTSIGSQGHFLQKKDLEKCSKEAKKRQDKLKPGGEEQNERDARRMAATSCKEF